MGQELRHKEVGISILAGGFAFPRFDDRLRVGDSLGVSTPMIMSPLCPTEDIGTSIRAFGSIIKPLFAITAAALNSAMKDECPTRSFVELLIPEAR